MSDSLQHKALLPTGFHDVLSPDARTRASIVSTLLEVFEHYGYEPVMPPTLEFEESLFTGSGKTLEHQTFRLMDPVSQKMMGIRPDITMQVARIATTRLVNAPLPIRLAYSGQVFRVKSTDLYGERQTTQAGIELIGVDNALADAEAVRVAIDALQRLGIPDISIDFNLPQLVNILLRNMAISDNTKARLRHALNKKDVATIASLAPAKDAKLLVDLVTPHSNGKTILDHLLALPLPEEAHALCGRLKDVVASLRKVLRDVAITIDPVEHRGFEYHTGIGFAIFSKQYTGEIARGGRYVITGSGEESHVTDAVGVTVYVNDLFRILPGAAPKPRAYVAAETPVEAISQLQEQGYATILAVSGADAEEEARRLKCDAVYRNGSVERL